MMNDKVLQTLMLIVGLSAKNQRPKAVQNLWLKMKVQNNTGNMPELLEQTNGSVWGLDKHVIFLHSFTEKNTRITREKHVVPI